jgi:hypothetical protein
MSLSSPPRQLRRAKLDNLALVPASLLPFKSEWQRLANQLPQGSTLIILPSPHSASRKSLEHTASQLRARGQRVMTIPADQLAYVDSQPVSVDLIL